MFGTIAGFSIERLAIRHSSFLNAQQLTNLLLGSREKCIDRRGGAASMPSDLLAREARLLPNANEALLWRQLGQHFAKQDILFDLLRRAKFRWRAGQDCLALGRSQRLLHETARASAHSRRGHVSKRDPRVPM